MGVKSTVILTRADAEQRFVDLTLAAHRVARETQAKFYSNEVLEDLLERMNDAAHDGEGFENYLIEETKK